MLVLLLDDDEDTDEEEGEEEEDNTVSWYKPSKLLQLYNVSPTIFKVVGVSVAPEYS